MKRKTSDNNQGNWAHKSRLVRTVFGLLLFSSSVVSIERVDACGPCRGGPIFTNGDVPDSIETATWVSYGPIFFQSTSLSRTGI